LTCPTTEALPVARIRDGKRMVGCLTSIWWDQYSANKTKKRFGRCLVESVMMYGSELWVENKSKKNMLQAVEMD
jgi:hypothetical protein